MSIHPSQHERSKHPLRGTATLLTQYLNTPRLILRPYQASDLAAFVALNADPEVRRRVGDPLTPTEATTRFQRFFAGGPEDAWAITLRESGLYIGHCWLVMRGEAELALLLVPGVWRQGYGTEVAVALLDHALIQRRYSRVVATVDADHPASIRVLERAGMRRECDRHDAHGVYFVYSARRPVVGDQAG